MKVGTLGDKITLRHIWISDLPENFDNSDLAQADAAFPRKLLPSWDELNKLTEEGSCYHVTQFITPEGGVRIICEVGETFVTVAQKAKNSQQARAYLHPPKSIKTSSGTSQITIESWEPVLKSLVFTFPPLCKDKMKSSSNCDFITWSDVILAIEIDVDISNGMIDMDKFIIAKNIKIEPYTKFSFGGFEESAEPSIIEIFSGKELKAQNALKYVNLTDSASYMNLHLLHDNDSRRIENQTQILKFWENQMTLIFSKSKNPADNHGLIRFVSVDKEMRSINFIHLLKNCYFVSFLVQLTL